MNEEFKKGIKDLKDIRLTTDEKAGILKSVLEAPVLSPYAPKRSFWNVLVYRYHIGAIAMVLLVISGLTSFSAETALPGEKLYFVKVGVNEPLRDFINTTPETRAEWESVKAARRLDEAADLVVAGKLDEKKRNDLETRFGKHVDAFASSVVGSASSTEKTELLEMEFEANISARTKVLERLNKDKEPTATLKATAPTAAIIQKAVVEKEMTGATTTNEDAYAKEESDKNRRERQREELKKFEKAISEKLKERRESNRQREDKLELDRFNENQED